MQQKYSLSCRFIYSVTFLTWSRDRRYSDDGEYSDIARINPFAILYKRMIKRPCQDRCVESSHERIWNDPIRSVFWISRGLELNDNHPLEKLWPPRIKSVSRYPERKFHIPAIINKYGFACRKQTPAKQTSQKIRTGTILAWSNFDTLNTRKKRSSQRSQYCVGFNPCQKFFIQKNKNKKIETCFFPEAASEKRVLRKRACG